jgi:hypothetical protein
MRIRAAKLILDQGHAVDHPVRERVTQVPEQPAGRRVRRSAQQSDGLRHDAVAGTVRSAAGRLDERCQPRRRFVPVTADDPLQPPRHLLRDKRRAYRQGHGGAELHAPALSIRLDVQAPLEQSDRALGVARERCSPALPRHRPPNHDTNSSARP